MALRLECSQADSNGGATGSGQGTERAAQQESVRLLILMRREARNYIATACIALCFASFPSYLWLFFRYQSIRPSQPHPELGFVHALNNHGSYVYLTDVEATGLSFLIWMFLLGFGLFIAVVPKKYTPTGIEHDLINPTREQNRVLWIAVICYFALIIFVGQYIVAFAVSHGLIIVM